MHAIHVHASQVPVLLPKWWVFQHRTNFLSFGPSHLWQKQASCFWSSKPIAATSLWLEPKKPQGRYGEMGRVREADKHAKKQQNINKQASIEHSSIWSKRHLRCSVNDRMPKQLEACIASGYSLRSSQSCQGANLQGHLMPHLSLHRLLLKEHVGAWSSYALPHFCQFCLFSRSDLIQLSRWAVTSQDFDGFLF